MNIQELLAKTLSPRQKSVLRKLMHSVGSYQMRDVEKWINDVVTIDGAKTFLQIGVNDGYFADPLNLAIFRHRLRGAFVEPQLYYFEQLRRTYAGFEGLQFLQCAIAETAGHMQKFSLDSGSGNLPRWANRVGTLPPTQLLRYGDQIPNVERYIRTSDVECITVGKLLSRSVIRDPHIIVIDAEGYDYQILSQFDFRALTTKLLVFEAESLPDHQQTSCLEQLTAADFAIVPVAQDTIAIRRSTKTFRATLQS